VKKGAKLYIEGKLSTSSWDDKASGQKRYKTEIVVLDLSLLSGRDEGSGRAASGSGSSASFDQRAASPANEYAQSAEISDDDIPF